MLTIHGSSSNEEISSCSRISQAMWLSLMPKLLLIRNRKRIGMMKMNLIFNNMSCFINKPEDQFKAAIWDGFNWIDIKDVTDGKCDFRYEDSKLCAYVPNYDGILALVPFDWWVINNNGNIDYCSLEDAKIRFPYHFEKKFDYISYQEGHNVTIVQWDGKNNDEILKVGKDHVYFDEDGCLYLNSFYFPDDNGNTDTVNLSMGFYCQG